VGCIVKLPSTKERRDAETIHTSKDRNPRLGSDWIRDAKPILTD